MYKSDNHSSRSELNYLVACVYVLSIRSDIASNFRSGGTNTDDKDVLGTYPVSSLNKAVKSCDLPFQHSVQGSYTHGSGIR